jgi:FAD/FMN-containing dehydrogenase
MLDDKELAELASLPLLHGKVLLDREACGIAATDFGNIVSRHPLAVVKPRSSSDVAASLRYCQERKISVAIRGQGHSTNGQAQTKSGLIIDSAALNAVHRIDDAQIIVGAGATWRDVLAAALPLGRTPPVLTDYLGLSVGGTLSVGGLGGTSASYGSQADNALEIEVATGSGDIRICSPTREPALFDAVLCGLGQCAFITRATLPLIPAPTNVRRYKLYYRRLADLTTDQCRLLREARFDYLEGQIYVDLAGTWGFMLEACTFFNPPDQPDDLVSLDGLQCDRWLNEITEMSYLEFLERLDPSVTSLQLTGEWRYAHPWINLFLPAAQVDQFVGGALDVMQPEDIGTSGVILLYPVRTNRLRRPMMPVPEDDFVFLLAVLRAALPNSFGVRHMIASNRNLYERAKSIGGTVYPIGTIPFTQEDWRTHFGPTWPMLCRMKARYDQQCLLTPGQGIFGADNRECLFR